MNIKAYAEREVHTGIVALHLSTRDIESRALYVARPLIFDKIEPGTRTQPAIRLEREDAQRLMDELWQAGLRPSEGTGSAGSLAATERHLSDMRSIAFAALTHANINPKG